MKLCCDLIIKKLSTILLLVTHYLVNLRQNRLLLSPTMNSIQTHTHSTILISPRCFYSCGITMFFLCVFCWFVCLLFFKIEERNKVKSITKPGTSEVILMIVWGKGSGFEYLSNLNSVFTNIWVYNTLIVVWILENYFRIKLILSLPYNLEKEVEICRDAHCKYLAHSWC